MNNDDSKNRAFRRVEPSREVSFRKMKILIVTRAFHPEISPRSFRATELAKEFALQGHNVTVLTPRQESDHSKFEREHDVTICDLGKPVLKPIPSGKGKIVSLVRRVIKRFLLMAFEYPQIQWMFKVRSALKSEADYDLMISSAAPHPVHWGVAWAMRGGHRIARTWIADCGDPFMGATNDSFRKWQHFSFFEKWFMRKADYVTIPVGQKITDFYEEFHDKIRLIPQGFKIDRDALPTYRKNDIPHFAFAGSFCFGMRDPRSLLNYLSGLEQDFKFLVFSRASELLEEYVDRMNGRLILSGAIPRSDLLSKLAKMDFLIHLQNNNEWERPSKLIDYNIVGRPVLSIGKKLDERKLSAFLAGDYSDAMELGDVDQYRIENVAGKFLELAAEKD